MTYNEAKGNCLKEFIKIKGFIMRGKGLVINHVRILVIAATNT